MRNVKTNSKALFISALQHPPVEMVLYTVFFFPFLDNSAVAMHPFEYSSTMHKEDRMLQDVANTDP